MKVGFIGAGNMARAMIGGIAGAGVVPAGDILVWDASPAANERAAADFGVTVAADNRAAAAASDVLVLAVKPQYYPAVIAEVAPALREETVVVTIAPGWTLEKLGALLGERAKIVRCMPNTPAMVGAGMTAACPNRLVTEGDMAAVRALLESFGRCEEIPENLMDAVVAVSGSSPAYVYLFIEAMADAAVAEGMPREMSYRFAAQAVLGSAKMVLETGLHPGALKDMVCSPAGTTIEAVRVLEEKGLRSAVIEAMRACAGRCRK